MIAGEGAGDYDSRVCGQRICAQRDHGLSSAAGHGPPCRSPSAAQAMPAGGTVGRSLRSGSVPAGAGLPRRRAGKTGLRRFAVRDGVRRAGASPASDGAAVCSLLRYGRMCAGAGTADRRRSGSQRHFLHGCGHPDAASVRYGVLRRTVLDLSGSGPPQCAS